jgi:hypothetical protein
MGPRQGNNRLQGSGFSDRLAKSGGEVSIAIEETRQNLPGAIIGEVAACLFGGTSIYAAVIVDTVTEDFFMAPTTTGTAKFSAILAG